MPRAVMLHCPRAVQLFLKNKPVPHGWYFLGTVPGSPQSYKLYGPYSFEVAYATVQRFNPGEVLIHAVQPRGKPTPPKLNVIDLTEDQIRWISHSWFDGHKPPQDATKT